MARDLIGTRLVVADMAARVMETEAYTADDPASHSFGGPRVRNRAMFGPPGLAYIYRSYGIHWCLNVVCRSGDAVLLRALEPLEGLAAMAERRGTDDPRRLCSGPGKIGQAFGLTAAEDGTDILRVYPAAPVPLVIGPRIGITRATDRPWRFGLAESPFLSRRFAGT